MGQQQSSRHWFAQAQTLTRRRRQGRKVPLLGRIERARHLPYAPHTLHLDQRLRVICGPPGYKSTAEAVARAVVEFAPHYVIVEDRPDHSCYMRSLNVYDDQLEWDKDMGDMRNLNGKNVEDLFLVSPLPTTLDDITLTQADLEAMASGPVCADIVDSETTMGQLVRWNADTDVYCDKLTAIVNAHNNVDALGHQCKVVVADMPTWAMFAFLTRSLNFMQLCPLIHASVTKQFRQLTTRSPQEFMRLLKFSPLLNSVRAKYLTTIVRNLSSDINARVLVVSSASQLHSIRQEYSDLVYSHEQSLTSSLISKHWFSKSLPNKDPKHMDNMPPLLAEYSSNATPSVVPNVELHQPNSLRILLRELTLSSQTPRSTEASRSRQTSNPTNSSKDIADISKRTVTDVPDLVAPDCTEEAQIIKQAWLFSLFNAPPPAGIAVDGPRLDVYSWWLSRYGVPPPFFPDIPGSIGVESGVIVNDSQQWSDHAEVFLKAYQEMRDYVNHPGTFQLPGPDPIYALLHYQDDNADSKITADEALHNYFGNK